MDRRVVVGEGFRGGEGNLGGRYCRVGEGEVSVWRVHTCKKNIHININIGVYAYVMYPGILGLRPLSSWAPDLAHRKRRRGGWAGQQEMGSLAAG